MALGQFRRVGIRRFGRSNSRHQPHCQWRDGNGSAPQMNVGGNAAIEADRARPAAPKACSKTPANASAALHAVLTGIGWKSAQLWVGSGPPPLVAPEPMFRGV